MRAISMEGLTVFATDDRNRLYLYWYSDEVVIKRGLTLARAQKIVGTLSAIGAFVSGAAQLLNVLLP